jgi:hypothetical protein
LSRISYEILICDRRSNQFDIVSTILVATRHDEAISARMIAAFDK